MTKTTHTHRGTCQACGRVQAVDNKTKLLAKHGYTVNYGAFQFVCNAAGHKPAEFDVTFTRKTMAACLSTAAWHDTQVAGLKIGTVVPETFERWNKDKLVTKLRRFGGGTYQDKGGYDTLPIAQATEDERAARIRGQIRHHEVEAQGLRDHEAFLRRDVLPRLGHPLYEAEVARVYTKGMRLIHNGTEIELTHEAYNHFGQERIIGWYAQDVRGGVAEGKAFRYTTRSLNEAQLPGEPAKTAKKAAP